MINKTLLGYIFTTIISFALFGFLTVYSLIEYKHLLHESIHGVVIEEYNKNKSSYVYHTNKNQSLDGRYFFNKKSTITPRITDYIVKFPHCLDLYILELHEDGDYYLKGKVVGSY